MRLFALVHDGIVVALEKATENPFHRGQHSVDVTAVPVKVGDAMDHHGNVAPSPVMSAAQAIVRNQVALHGIAKQHVLKGVWMKPADSDKPVRLDVHHEALATLAALAAAGVGMVAAADGTIAKVDASAALKEIGAYMGKCMERAGALHEALSKDPGADMTQGWPDNGEPKEGLAPPAPVLSDDGAGIPANGVPVMVKPPEPDAGTSAAVTRLDGRDMPADLAAAGAAQAAAGAQAGAGDAQVQQSKAQAKG